MLTESRLLLFFFTGTCSSSTKKRRNHYFVVRSYSDPGDAELAQLQKCVYEADRTPVFMLTQSQAWLVHRALRADSEPFNPDSLDPSWQGVFNLSYGYIGSNITTKGIVEESFNCSMRPVWVSHQSSIHSHSLNCFAGCCQQHKRKVGAGSCYYNGNR